MRRYSPLTLEDFQDYSLHEPTAEDEKFQRRRARMTAAFVGTLVATVAVGGIYVDRTELDGTLTNGIAHEAGIAVHNAAVWSERQLGWIADHTPAS